MSKTILVLNGPNLNLLGTREPHIYGATTLKEVAAQCERAAAGRGRTVSVRQSNREYELIDWIHEAIETADGIIINAGAFTHTSVALMDALKNFKGPIIELHISNTHTREEFRHHSYISFVATGVIMGLGVAGYPIAVDAMIGLIEARAKAKPA